MGQEGKLEAADWGDIDGLMLPARDNTVVLETNVEAFVWVESLESSPKTETDFIPLNRVHESRVPLPSFGCSCRLNKDLVTYQHTGAFLRQTRDRKAMKSINFFISSGR